MNSFKLSYFLVLILLLSCGNRTTNSAQQQEVNQECEVANALTVNSTQQQEINQEYEVKEVFANNYVELDIKRLQVKTLPLVDSTNFDNFSFANKLCQAQIQKLRLDEKFDNVSIFYLNYRIDLSENFISIVVSYERGDHELFTVLINYDNDFRIIDILHIAYDEIAESLFRKISTISTDKIIVEKRSYMEEEVFVYQIDAEGRFLKTD